MGADRGGIMNEDVEKLAEALGAAGCCFPEDEARAVLESDWLAARVQAARADELEQAADGLCEAFGYTRTNPARIESWLLARASALHASADERWAL